MRHICLHGHFYQPPREDPWLGAVPNEPSAAPYPDWNARITAECYAPNASARLLAGGQETTVNNYGRLSFDFGPTLLRDLDRRFAAVSAQVQAGDAEAFARFGCGTALAHPYHHLILPLGSTRDKELEIAWGLADFERRFGRFPEGMWLPETAVDEATLIALARAGMRLVVLAPHQIESWRETPNSPWRQDPPPTHFPLLLELPGEMSLSAYLYDGELSQAVGFGGALHDGQALAERLCAKALAAPDGALISLAVDGESFGHHHRFGEMALAACLHHIEQREGIDLLPFAAHRQRFGTPTGRARVRPSAWSCAHGLGRWQADCGCRFEPGSSQPWRAPLRKAMERVRTDLDALFDLQIACTDPWQLAQDYGAALCGQQPLEALLQRHRVPTSHHRRSAELLAMLEASRAALTSCAWFFDHLDGLEVRQNLRWAKRALALAGRGAFNLEGRLLMLLAEARTADGRSGADLYQELD